MANFVPAEFKDLPWVRVSLADSIIKDGVQYIIIKRGDEPVGLLAGVTKAQHTMMPMAPGKLLLEMEASGQIESVDL